MASTLQTRRKRQTPSKSARGRARGKPLARYQEKRDFSRTPEPPPAVRGSRTLKARQGKTTAREFAYCVQKHLASHLHYDFRLESGGVLLSWAVPKGPSLQPRDKRLAMRVEDHPFDYKDFEGVIPAGYGAGVVMLWDTGTWEPEPGFEDVPRALAKGELKFRLKGVKLKGSWVLVRTGAATPTGEREHWLLIKHRDEWAGELDITTFAPRSVRSDRTFEEILTSNPEVWDSHAEGGMELRKIAEKVAALHETPAKKPGRRRGRAGK